MKLYIAIIFGSLLGMTPVMAEDTPATNVETDKAAELKAEQDRILAEKRASQINKNMAVKIDKMNETIQQQISIRLDMDFVE